MVSNCQSLLAGADVEGAHQTLGVVVRLDRRALAHRRADDDDVAGDDRRRVDADLAGFEIDLRAAALHDARLQIDDALGRRTSRSARRSSR